MSDSSPTPPPSSPRNSGAGGSSILPPPLTHDRTTDLRSSLLQFSLKISEKLNEDNFHLWRQQIEPYINAHNLTEFGVCSRVPPQFVDDEAYRTGTFNSAYSLWLTHDQMLLSWLQSTLSSEILSPVLGSTHSYELWDRLFAYFHKQTRAKACNLFVELCTPRRFLC
jgi:hypothetical protein